MNAQARFIVLRALLRYARRSEWTLYIWHTRGNKMETIENINTNNDEKNKEVESIPGAETTIWNIPQKSAESTAKARKLYKSAKAFLRKMETREPTTLIERDRILLKKHQRTIRKFEGPPTYFGTKDMDTPVASNISPIQQCTEHSPTRIVDVDERKHGNSSNQSVSHFEQSPSRAIDLDQNNSGNSSNQGISNSEQISPRISDVDDRKCEISSSQCIISFEQSTSRTNDVFKGNSGNRSNQSIRDSEQSASRNIDIDDRNPGNSSNQGLSNLAYKTEPAIPISKPMSDGNGNLNDQNKRTRSESPGLDNTPKRSRFPETPTTKAHSSGHKSDDKKLQYAVIDEHYSDGKITPERWFIVERKLLECMANLLKNGGSPENCNFQGASWSKGIKIVDCGNEESVKFLILAISKMGELWPKARLKVVSRESIDARNVCRVWIPPPQLTDEVIHNLLVGQNPTVNIKRWRLLSGKIDAKGYGRDLVFHVDDESVRNLTNLGGVLKFGLGTVKARIDKGNHHNDRTSSRRSY